MSSMLATAAYYMERLLPRLRRPTVERDAAFDHYAGLRPSLQPAKPKRESPKPRRESPKPRRESPKPRLESPKQSRVATLSRSR
jgi:hypothetical protein